MNLHLYTGMLRLPHNCYVYFILDYMPIHNYVKSNTKTLNIAPTIFPSPEAIHYVGEPVTITCIGVNGFSTVQWLINDTQYDHSQPDIDVTKSCTLSYIVFNSISQYYNSTAIRCEGSYSSGQPFSSAEVAILLQGKNAIIQSN